MSSPVSEAGSLSRPSSTESIVSMHEHDEVVRQEDVESPKKGWMGRAFSVLKSGAETVLGAIWSLFKECVGFITGLFKSNDKEQVNDRTPAGTPVIYPKAADETKVEFTRFVSHT